MRRIVEIIAEPSIPEMGGVRRAVVFDDGSGEVQSYVPQKKMWVPGGNLYSFRDAEGATPALLRKLGYDEEDIEKIFWRPEDD
ncbi:MAG: hypothetical protein QNJ30_12290 [Kiloniellales bacterium]|nr:hypothetical protein [Kiloniellales bacterium]